MERRYDIDWLRVIAIGLLLIYHITITFQPWGVFIGFIQNNTPLEKLWIPMSMLNIWRIPLLFFVSGMGVCFAMRKRNLKQLILERAKRIFVPFLFGIMVIVPLHIVLWQKYYNQDLAYSPSPGHLWFLANIFIYVIVLSPVFYLLKKYEGGKMNTWLKAIYSNPLGLIFVSVPFAIEAIILNPEIFELYAMTIHGFFLGLLAFFFGFTFVHSGDVFWNTVVKWRWLYLGSSTLLFVFRLYRFELNAPNYLMSIESTIWIFAVLGFGFKYLNRPSNVLQYLSQGAYPIYIIHMLFLYLGAFLILSIDIDATYKFLLIVVFTGGGCMFFYEFIIRRSKLLRLLFGLKTRKHDNNILLAQMQQ